MVTFKVSIETYPLKNTYNIKYSNSDDILISFKHVDLFS